jgi:hypothetical protein
MKLANEYDELYIECLEKENPDILGRMSIPFLENNHTILYSEEPNIIGKKFLKLQYKCEYTLETRSINASLDGDNMDIEFYEAKLKNGMVGHLEFDFSAYQRNKVFYILDKVIEPMIQTGDIGKLLDSSGGGCKIIYIRNLDVIMNGLSDDKTEKKILSWLEKFVHTTRFLFTFYNYNGNITSKILNYCMSLRVKRLLNRDGCLDGILGGWLRRHVGESAVSRMNKRGVDTFLGFRYYLRQVVNEEYYKSFYDMMEDLHEEKLVKNKFGLLRVFLIGWLQSGKNYRELINELVLFVGKIEDSELRHRLLMEISQRSASIENSKKIMYHLESVLSIFV